MTNKCNSECRYCYKKSFDDFGNNLNEKFKFDFSIPSKISYDVEDLKNFIEKSNEKSVITFYGGEPLLEIDKIKEIVDKINARFMIQTNGKLLNKLDFNHINKFEKILVSLDGNKDRTDFNRGKGTYGKVIENINLIRKNGFKNEIIARMTVDEHSNIYEDVLHLLSIAGSVHWQLDAGFYYKDYKNRDFTAFSARYNQGVKKLVNYWVENMKAGKVLKIYPFLGIFESLYYNKKEKLRCGSGYANYTIATDGMISVCPIMHDATAFQIGNIMNSNVNNLKQVYVDGFCSNCDILDLCGGRCLYANKAKLWPKEGQRQICSTIRFLINSVKERIPEIKKLIESKIVKKSDFYYEKYFGPEIIP